MLGKLIIFALLGAMTISLPGQVVAQTSECGKKRDVTAGALDEATWKRMNDIFEDVGGERYDSAFEKLQKMNARARGNYEKALLAQALAQVEWSRSNYDAALTNFETAVRLDALPDLTHFSLMYQISQLYYLKDRYDEALDKLALWMCKVPKEKITPAAYYLQAAIYAAKKDWKNVVPASKITQII